MLQVWWVGHVSIYCPRDQVRFVFAMGHKKSDCPGLTRLVVSTPALATLRITDVYEGKVEALVVWIRAFQLQAKETL